MELMASDSSALLRSLVPVLLALLADIKNLLIAIALAYFVPLLLVHLGELDYLHILLLARPTDGIGSRTR